MDRTFGFIQKFDSERGFGFIASDSSPDVGRGVFFHIASVAPGNVVSVGQRVSFIESVDSRNGKVQAFDVKCEDDDDVTGEYGTVVTWRQDKGFGFIRPDGGDKTIFCHKSTVLQIDGRDYLHVGRRVWFQKSTRVKSGKLSVINVMALEDNSENETTN